MDDKLQLLFDKIDLEKDYYEYFIDAKLLKIKIDEKKKTCKFEIEVKETIPLVVYNHVSKLIALNFKDFKTSLNLTCLTINYSKFFEYFNEVLEKAKLFIMYEDDLKINDDTITLEVCNKMEYEKALEQVSVLKKYLKPYGFKNFEMNIVINEEKAKAIKEEIEKEKNIKIETLKINEEANNIIYGKEITGEVVPISSITLPEETLIIEGYLFDKMDVIVTRDNLKICTLKVSDKEDSVFLKLFIKDDNDFKKLEKGMKVGNWYRIQGKTRDDRYAKDLVLNVFSINKIDRDDKIKDEALEKRVELHAHSFMSQMDGLMDAKAIIKRAKEWGHKAVCITDHSACHTFPETYFATKDDEDFKMIYGVELELIDDKIDIVINEKDLKLIDQTYVVFDTETTGFNAGTKDSMIEIGAVKILNGEIIDRFDELINPKKPLRSKIIEITSITDDMLKDKRSEEEVLKDFVKWIGDLPLVAHNAKFDRSFIEMGYQKYDLGKFTNPLIDTLEMSRALEPNVFKHSLSALVKRYNVAFDEDHHHRADYDAEATALVFDKMLKKAINQNIDNINKLNKLVPKEDIHKSFKTSHITVLVQNQIGLKNMFKIVSLANTKYLHKTPRILRSALETHREGLLFGSACYLGEIFEAARTKTDDELRNLMSFYDYIEVQPLDVYKHLVEKGDFANNAELIEHINKIVKVAKEADKLVVATSDAHYLDPADKIYRSIIVNQKVPGGGRHILARDNLSDLPNQHFRTTNEMLLDFSFLDDETKQEIVITNPNKIADMIEKVVVVRKQLMTPKMDNSKQEFIDIIYGNAHKIYGDPLPQVIQDRLDAEVEGITSKGFDVIYLIARKLVKKSNADGYFVGSRGSVGSSFAATMLEITEVNPLPAHYVCPNCKKSIFEIDGKKLSDDYSSGYDLPDKTCECGTQMKKDGNDMPFATFIGFKGDKTPDIDLNFSSENQSAAHDYTKVLFGEKFVYRAGTVGTVAEKTAYGFVKGYCEEKGVNLKEAEIDRLAKGCVGVKRTTGQHPGGIIVIPNYMDVFDFAPYQYPANEVGEWYTLHFEYHSLEDDILKLDILGHDDPTMLKKLGDLSGKKIEEIPFDDPGVMGLFQGTETLGVKEEDIMCEVGTYGIPEFGTKFVIEMVKETKPKTFGELLIVSGLSHGTDVWLGNAQELIKNGIKFKDVIGCRDDIMLYLSKNGIEPFMAFQIMEMVRKGKHHKNPDKWQEYVKLMEDNNIPDWYIGSLAKIKYMFPKAHATAYVMMACRVAWFKVHMPIIYYCSFFSVRASDFDIETMIKGYEAIKAKILEIKNKGFEKTQKEDAVLSTLEIALEMTARGFKFAPLNLEKSDSMHFVIDEDEKTLIPPFRTIDGLGDTVAKKIVEERSKGNFISIEDFSLRAKASSTLVEKLKLMGLFGDLPESSQLSLF